MPRKQLDLRDQELLAQTSLSRLWWKKYPQNFLHRQQDTRNKIEEEEEQGGWVRWEGDMFVCSDGPDHSAAATAGALEGKLRRPPLPGEDKRRLEREWKGSRDRSLSSARSAKSIVSVTARRSRQPQQHRERRRRRQRQRRAVALRKHPVLLMFLFPLPCR